MEDGDENVSLGRLFFHKKWGRGAQLGVLITRLRAETDACECFSIEKGSGTCVRSAEMHELEQMNEDTGNDIGGVSGVAGSWTCKCGRHRLSLRAQIEATCRAFEWRMIGPSQAFIP